MQHAAAEIVREYGPFEGVSQVAGVTFDGRHIWIAVGGAIKGIDPSSGEAVRQIDVPAHAGTAFDGRYLFQIGDGRIQKIDPGSGQVVSSIPAPEGGGSGMAWAEGTLWVGQHRSRRILQVDPETGAVLRTLESDRFVTGVSWLGAELWHATWEADESQLRRIDPQSGEVIEQVAMPADTFISGLESDGAGLFYCGGGNSGTVRAVRRPAPRAVASRP